MRNHSKLLPALALAAALLPVAAMARGVWLGAQNPAASQTLVAPLNAQPLSPFSLGRSGEGHVPVESLQANGLPRYTVMGAVGAGTSANFSG